MEERFGIYKIQKKIFLGCTPDESLPPTLNKTPVPCKQSEMGCPRHKQVAAALGGTPHSLWSDSQPSLLFLSAANGPRNLFVNAKDCLPPLFQTPVTVLATPLETPLESLSPEANPWEGSNCLRGGAQADSTPVSSSMNVRD